MTRGAGGTLAVARLVLGHFRSYEALTLDCGADDPPRPLAFTGPNGAGKTNILEAVSMLSPGRGLRRARGDELARTGGPGWKVRAVLQAAGQVHEVETWALAGQPRQLRIDGKAAPRIALGGLVRMLWLVPAQDRLWLDGAEGRRRFLDRIALSFFPDHARLALDYERALRERGRLLREGGGDPAWFRALEGRMAEAGAALTRNRLAAIARLERAQQGAATAFPAARLALTGPEGAPPLTDAADLADALAAGRSRDIAAGRSLTGPHRADLAAVYAAKDIPARACSTGEQKALLIALILANARALASDGTRPLLLLDEVAAHLDPDRRRALFDEICALGVQAWMTGTDRALFYALGDRGRHFDVRDQNGLSRVTETEAP